MEMNIYLHDRLICTSLKISYKGSTKIIDNVAIDPSGMINGLIGLGLLNQLHAVIDIPIVFLKD